MRRFSAREMSRTSGFASSPGSASSTSARVRSAAQAARVRACRRRAIRPSRRRVFKPVLRPARTMPAKILTNRCGPTAGSGRGDEDPRVEVDLDVGALPAAGQGRHALAEVAREVADADEAVAVRVAAQRLEQRLGEGAVLPGVVLDRQSRRPTRR